MSGGAVGSAVGTGVNRIEGPAKLTGAAKYSMDNTAPGTVHAVLVGSAVARGTILAIDSAEAEAEPGVLRVLTRADMPTFGAVPPFQAGALFLPLQEDVVRFAGEPVAIVIATTIEAAEQGRALVSIHYEEQEPVRPGKGAREVIAGAEGDAGTFWPYGHPFKLGDVEAGFAAAAARFDATYVQPARHHNPMETSGTLASWEGECLTVWDSVQASSLLPPIFAAALGVEPEDVKVVSPFTGGGFGCKGWVWPHQILTAAAAKVVGEPVKLHLRRADQYAATGFQPLMSQRIELGADREGHLTALRHRASNITGLAETYLEASTEVKALYACPAIETSQEIERVSVSAPTPMRCPNEGPGLWALESAMNEFAHSLEIDPLDLRLRNYAEKDPLTGRPWSSKKLREAYLEGAELFGWYGRPHGGRTEGPWRIGSGMASAIGGTMRTIGAARVRVRRDGSAVVETDVQDIGTGLQTLLTQITADEFGLAVDGVEVVWGDNALPTTGPIYGSSTMHTGSAVALACRDARRKLGELSEAKGVVDALNEAGMDEVVGDAKSELPGGVPVDHDGGTSGFSMRTFGAAFVEVAVDPELGFVRLRRMVGAYSVGRVINPRTARSQMIGSLTWGWGKATMEHSDLDPSSGSWLSKNLSGVHLPTNADIPADITIHFVEEFDEHASAIGAKGIGEFGSTGIDAAIADAVHDAIGIRVRELPITPKRILDGLESAGR